MKKIVIAVMAVVVMMSSVVKAELSGSISAKMLSQYVAPNGVVLHDDAVQQTDLFILLPQGFYADLWASLPLDGKENLGKEVDGTLGWSGNVGTTGLVADIGVSYFNYISLTDSAGDMINPYAKVSKDFAVAENHTLTSYAKVEFPFAVNNDVVSGTYAYVGFKHTWQIAKEISLTQDAYAVYDNGAYGLENGWVGKYNATASAQLGKGISLDLSLSAFAPLTSFSDRKTETVPAVGLTYNF